MCVVNDCDIICVAQNELRKFWFHSKLWFCCPRFSTTLVSVLCAPFVDTKHDTCILGIKYNILTLI